MTTNHPWRPNRESSQAVADISSRSNQSEISSIRDVFGGAGLLKVCLLDSSLVGKSIFFMIMELKFMCLFSGRAF